MTPLILVIVWALSGSGAAMDETSSRAQAQTGPPQKYSLNDVRVEMRRLGCLGKCPVYTVVLKGDGNGYYDGRMHVKTVGKRSFAVGRDMLEAILQGFYDVRFFTLTDADLRSLQEVHVEPTGEVAVADAPESIVFDVEEIWLAISIGSYHKEAHASAFGISSSPAWALGRLIDRLAKTKTWTGITEPPSIALHPTGVGAGTSVGG